MFQSFSSSYYIRPYWIVEDKSKNKINETEYKKISQSLQSNSIIMKIGNTHFEVIGDDKVPKQTMHLSKNIMDSFSDSYNAPCKVPVLLFKN